MSNDRTISNLIQLLRDARDVCQGSGLDDPNRRLTEVVEPVLAALAGTWVAEILPHCPTCATALNDDESDCPYCGPRSDYPDAATDVMASCDNASGEHSWSTTGRRCTVCGRTAEALRAEVRS